VDGMIPPGRKSGWPESVRVEQLLPPKLCGSNSIRLYKKQVAQGWLNAWSENLVDTSSNASFLNLSGIHSDNASPVPTSNALMVDI
jgi:hypothetical protein